MAASKVREYFKKYNMDGKIIVLNECTGTVKEAASALHCEENEIAKTLSFNLNDEPILIVTAGNAKIDNAKYKYTFNTKARMLAYDEVEKKIGHAVGGVCPFAICSNVKVYLDESLKKFEYVYPACGSDNTAIRLSLDELEKYSNYLKWIDVTK